MTHARCPAHSRCSLNVRSRLWVEFQLLGFGVWNERERGYTGRHEEQKTSVPAKVFQGQDWTLKFHTPGTHCPSPLTIHKHPAPQSRNPKQSRPCWVRMVQGEELPHGGSRDSTGTAGAFRPPEGCVWCVRKWGRGAKAEGPRSGWKLEGGHLSADPELRSCTEFTHPCNHLFLYSCLYSAY